MDSHRNTKQPSPTGIAVLGCAHIHMPDVEQVLGARNDVRAVAAWDHQPDRAAQWAGRLGCAAEADLRQIWQDPAVTAVIIMAETVRHQDLVTSAAHAGKDVFVEKPLAMDAAGAREAATAVSRAGVRFHVGYHLRQVPAHQHLRRLVRLGRLGRVVRLRGRFAHRGILDDIFAGCPWMTEPGAAGFGGFGDLGVHLLDLLCLLADCPVLEVAAHVDPLPGPRAIDRTGEATLLFADGAVGLISAGWTECSSPITIEVHGTDGWAVASAGELTVEPPQPDLSEVEVSSPSAGAALGCFLDAVTGLPDAKLVDVQTAARHVELLEAMYRAARSRTWVRV